MKITGRRQVYTKCQKQGPCCRGLGRHHIRSFSKRVERVQEGFGKVLDGVSCIVPLDCSVVSVDEDTSVGDVFVEKIAKPDLVTAFGLE